RPHAGQPPHVAGLAVLVQRDRPVGHLDVRRPTALHQGEVVGQPAAPDEVLEQGPAEVEADARVFQYAGFAVQVLGDQCGAPAELHQVDVLAVTVDQVGERAGGQARVDNHGDAGMSHEKPPGRPVPVVLRTRLIFDTAGGDTIRCGCEPG